MINHIKMTDMPSGDKCDVMNCQFVEKHTCPSCKFKMCAYCADSLFIDFKQVCPRCTFGANFEGIFPGIINLNSDILSDFYKGRYNPLSYDKIYKYAVYKTREPNELILVFRLDDGNDDRFMSFSLFIKGNQLMVKFSFPLNITGIKYYEKDETDEIDERYNINLSLQDTFNQNKHRPALSSLTPIFKSKVFDEFRRRSIEQHFNQKPIFGVKWWRLMVWRFGTDFIQFDKDIRVREFEDVPVVSSFRPRRRVSKSVKRRRKLRSKSKSRKRSSKPRPRRR